MPPAQRPVIRDFQQWKQQILEHRRALLERVVAEFPQTLTTHRTAIEMLRGRLSGPSMRTT
jgi:antirestriction protein